jgi:methylphosphotriester-DNA--protein-cysteine methyltransferase
MSRSKFAQVFHRMLGTPPHSYATALRIWLAQSGLIGCKVSAAVFAGWLGFSSPQHFSRAFKASTGLTPQEYRRRWGAPWVRESLEEPPKKSKAKAAKKKAAKRRAS